VQQTNFLRENCIQRFREIHSSLGRIAAETAETASKASSVCARLLRGAIFGTRSEAHCGAPSRLHLEVLAIAQHRTLKPQALNQAKRTAVHQTIRKFFPLLNTDSVKVEEETCVRVFSTTHLGPSPKIREISRPKPYTLDPKSRLSAHRHALNHRRYTANNGRRPRP
jgi:hypothetical protein